MENKASNMTSTTENCNVKLEMSWADDEDEHSTFKFEAKSVNFDIKHEQDDFKESSKQFQEQLKMRDLKTEDGEYEYEDGEVVTPQKGSKSPFKSAKSLSVYKKRDNPYSKSATSTSETVFERLGPEVAEKKNGNKKMKNEQTKRETDPAVLDRRQKQIDYGKNTLGYDRYRQLVPKDKRTPEDPVTPNKYGLYPRRGFDGLIKLWRLKLHKYDPPSSDEPNSNSK